MGVARIREAGDLVHDVRLPGAQVSEGLQGLEAARTGGACRLSRLTTLRQASNEQINRPPCTRYHPTLNLHHLNQ